MATATFDDLREAIQSLTEEVRVLRMAVDDLCGELQWANCNPPQASDGHEQLRRPTPLLVTSLPIDPAAPGWKINAVDQATIQRLRQEAVARSARSPNASQQQLF